MILVLPLRLGGFSHWHGIRICACLLRHFFAKFGIAIGGFFGIAIGGFLSETKEPKLQKLGVFLANYCKKHPIGSKLGVFLSKMVYWWVGNLAKNWYRDSQIFEVRQAHPRTILVKEPPPGPCDSPKWLTSSVCLEFRFFWTLAVILWFDSPPQLWKSFFFFLSRAPPLDSLFSSVRLMTMT